MKKLTIIGAGWSGLACAVAATQAGWQVELYETSHTAGGRARNLEQSFAGVPLDNGQHILDVRGLKISQALAFETEVSQWPGVVTVGVFAHQKAQVCLLGTASGVKTLNF